MDESTACDESHGTPAPEGVGRRGFLLAAGVATVGVWVAPSIVSLSPALAATSPGPDEHYDTDAEQDAGDNGAEQDVGDNGRNGSNGGNGEVADEQQDDIEVLDRVLTRKRPSGPPTGDTPTGGTPTGGTPGRDDVEVLGVSLTSGESPLPRTGAGRDALLGAGSAAMVAGATLLRINPSQDVAVDDIDPSGESDPS